MTKTKESAVITNPKKKEEKEKSFYSYKDLVSDLALTKELIKNL